MNPKPTLCVLAALGCLSTLAFAITPTITSVSGTVQSGLTLTITGSSMIQEDRTNWDPLFIINPNASGFEGLSPIADGYQTNGCPAYTSAVKLMGSRSINMHNQGQHIRLPDGSGLASCNWQWVIQASLPLTTWQDVYLRSYSRWNNTSWATHDVKYWWTQGGPFGYFWSFRTNADGSPPTRFGITDPAHFANWYEGAIPGGAMQNNKWYLFEGHFRTQGSGNYVIELWVDNQLIISQAVASGVSPNTSLWGWESNTNMYDTPAGWVSDHWQDGFAVSKTRIGPASLIEISNCPTYGSGTKVYQEPLFLSDGSSQIKASLSGLGSGPYFLWVTNNRNERSLPFSLGGSGTACAGSTLPAPGNLRVQ